MMLAKAPSAPPKVHRCESPSLFVLPPRAAKMLLGGDNTKLTDDEMRDTMRVFLRRLDFLEGQNEELRCALNYSRDRFDTLKRNFDQFKGDALESLSNVAMLPEAPLRADLELAEDKGDGTSAETGKSIRAMTVFEREKLYQELERLKVKDATKIENVARISRTPHEMGVFTFRVDEWTPKTQWVVYFFLSRGRVKKAVKVHTGTALFEERFLSTDDVASVKVVRAVPSPVATPVATPTAAPVAAVEAVAPAVVAAPAAPAAALPSPLAPNGQSADADEDDGAVGDSILFGDDDDEFE